MQLAFETTRGSRKVTTLANAQRNHFYSVLFVNQGQTATTITGKHSTEQGARKWAAKQLAK